MRHCKVDIQEPDLYLISQDRRHTLTPGKTTYQFWVRMDGLCDALPGECLFPEPPFDTIQHLSMCRVILVQHVPELEIRGAEAVAEVLCENPPAV